MTFIRYIEVDFTFGLLDCARYNEDFVISKFYSIHFTVNLAGLRNVIRYIPRTSLHRDSLNRSSTVKHISVHFFFIFVLITD